jgi:AcrR family transcriptional regulator
VTDPAPASPNATSLPGIPDIGAIGGAELTEKHREVLREAMRLFAERGFRGASLRELARRVGMQQPSLYHYFRSKDELVEQILVTFGFGGIGATPNEGQLPARVEDYPALLAAIVTWLYDHTDWPVFVRFMFNLSLESPKHQKRLREMFVETTATQMHAVVRYYVDSGQISAIDAEHLTRMVLSAVALPLIEERLLFPSAGSHRGLADYVAFVVRFAKAGIPAMAKSAGTETVVLPVVRSEIAEKKAPKRAKAKAPPRDRPTDRRTRASGRPRGR